MPEFEFLTHEQIQQRMEIVYLDTILDDRWELPHWSGKQRAKRVREEYELASANAMDRINNRGWFGWFVDKVRGR